MSSWGMGSLLTYSQVLLAVGYKVLVIGFGHEQPHDLDVDRVFAAVGMQHVCRERLL